MKRLMHREEGSALAAVLIMMMVVTTIAIAASQTAMHSNDVTVLDREKLQAVSAADAGVNDAIERIQNGAGCDLTAGPKTDLTDGGGLVGRYQTRIDAEAGTGCGTTLNRVVHSWGYGATGEGRSLRHLEVSVKLVPQFGFPYTIFAEGGLGIFYVKNNGTITGDVYTENLDQSKNNISAENIITTGTIETQNNAIYSGTLWAGGNVTLGSGSNVGKSIIATGTASGTQGNISLGSNALVGADVRAKGTVTVGAGAVVNGSVAENDPNLPEPPSLVKPTFTWNVNNYSPAPTTGNASSITSTLSTNRNNLSGVYYSSQTNGTITIPSTATVTGDLTIISAGKVALGSTLTSSGGPWRVVIAALSTANDAIAVNSAFTAAPSLDTLIYTVGGIDIKNGMTMTGAMYANTIDAKNSFSISNSTALATAQPPGFTFDESSASSYTVQPINWREIVPGAPPA